MTFKSAEPTVKVEGVNLGTRKGWAKMVHSGTENAWILLFILMLRKLKKLILLVLAYGLIQKFFHDRPEIGLSQVHE